MACRQVTPVAFRSPRIVPAAIGGEQSLVRRGKNFAHHSCSVDAQPPILDCQIGSDRRQDMSAENDESLLYRLVSELSTVPGTRAIALGGSRALGTASEHSDYDLGVYYDANFALDIDALRAVAIGLDDCGAAATVTPIDGWGPWINGGGWLTIRGQPVDVLYRDLSRIRRVIDECRAGEFGRHYQPGHPHAFITTIYMGEIAYNRPLWDPQGDLIELKALTDPYPPALANALVDYFLFEAKFSLDNAHKNLDRNDVNYLAGCGFRCVACLCQVIFALNGKYLINEKGAVTRAEQLACCPNDFGNRVAAGYQEIGSGAPAAALATFNALLADTVALPRHEKTLVKGSSGSGIC
jgi:Nucleotidyltransferase domain